jgi:glycosyltransferase involved in cell wall biosynthesis
MRILMTMPWGQRLGGAEEQLQVMLEAAGETGHTLEFVFFEDGPWPNELRDSGFRVDVIEAGRLRQLHRFFATVIRLTGIIHRRRPDLILNWAAKTHLYGAPAALLAGYGDRVMWWQQVITIGHWIDRCATALPTIGVGCNSRAGAEAQERLRPHRPAFVWYAGARTPRSYDGPPPLELPDGVPVVGLVARLQPWKGQDRVLEAQALLRERGHEMHLVLVGGDAYGLSPEYAQSLPRAVDRLGLADAVTMTGHVPDAGPYIEQMDIVLNASDPEPFGISLVEGMSRGVAAVGVNSGGPGEYIEHGQTGMLARSGEPAALAEALEPLLASEELRRTIARAGREQYLREFTDSAMRDRFFEILEAADAKRRGTSSGSGTSNGPGTPNGARTSSGPGTSNGAGTPNGAGTSNGAVSARPIG